ncbi:PREDICTED: NAC domain-containing protein 17-like isoform X2 [Ipomoea nil]|uniref:NAC domain-containing protein 17-like isoform X2 n=1 Tax=Ipomoea nil TaxID=35883 RepID=UPI000901413D|nr:PREDICTED: NAC domain-containing protein 17-like isoform X2 [Ipomoea nil]
MELTSEPSSCSCLCGQRFPPGFRFQPTDEELVVYYLKRKICRQPIMRDVIGETDVYKREPEELPELSKLKTGDRQWFFFSPRDRKYPNGARSNRATKQGFWKVTGRDRIITCNSRNVGVKKTLVFYKGRTPTIKPSSPKPTIKPERTDWVMYEYTMDEEELKRCPSAQDYYALYRIFRKSGIGPKNGEQYGAPFREEDWADDDCLTVNPLVEQEKYTNQVNDVVNVESPIPNDFEISLVNIEELLDLLEDEPDLPVQNAILHPTTPHNVQANVDVTQCSTSQPQLPEAPEFTSAPVYHGLNPQMVEEDYLEGFLEVDDLAGPEPSINNFNKPGEIMEIQQYGYDMGTREARHPNQPYANNAENGMVNPVSTYFSDNHETMNSQQLYLNENNEGSNRLWSPDQRCNIATPAEANHEVFHPATLDGWYGTTMSSSKWRELFCPSGNGGV